jgi:hypothetical protein
VRELLERATRCGLELRGALERAVRARVVAEQRQGAAVRDLCIGILGSECDRLLEIRARLVGLAAAEADLARREHEPRVDRRVAAVERARGVGEELLGRDVAHALLAPRDPQSGPLCGAEVGLAGARLDARAKGARER